MEPSYPQNPLANYALLRKTHGLGVGWACVVLGALSVQATMLSIAGGPSPDGVRYIALAQEIRELGLLAALKRQGSEPVFPVLVAGVYSVLRAVVGDSALLWIYAVQVAAALGMVAATLVVFCVTREWLGPLYASLASLFFCLLPEGARLGADGIADSVSLAFVATGLYCWFRSLGSFFGQEVPSLGTNSGFGEPSLLGPQRYHPCRPQVSCDAAPFRAPTLSKIVCSPWSAILGNLGWVFAAGLAGALGSMSHRGALTFLAFSAIFLGWLLIRGSTRFVHLNLQVITGGNGRILTRKQWAIGPGKNSDGFDLYRSKAATQSPGIYLLGLLGTLAAWTAGVLAGYGPYWMALGFSSVRDLLNSAVRDVIVSAPYPNWPKERGAVAACTHLVASEELFARGVPGEVSADSVVGHPLHCCPEKLVLLKMFVHREIDVPAGFERVLYAAGLFGQELADAFGYFLGLPALIGGIFLWRPRATSESFARGFVLFHIAVCLWWTYDHGYIGARHLLPIAIFGVGAASWLCYTVSHRIFPRSGMVLAVGLLVLLGLDTFSSRPNVQAAAFGEAGRFLREGGHSEAWLADEFGYTGFWARVPNIAIDDMWAYLEDRRLKYIVVRHSLLEVDSWRSELLRGLLEAAGQELAVFSAGGSEFCGFLLLPSPRVVLHRLLHRSRRPEAYSVIVYRWDSDRWKEKQMDTISRLAKAASRRGISLTGWDLQRVGLSSDKKHGFTSEEVNPGERIPPQPTPGFESPQASFRR